MPTTTRCLPKKLFSTNKRYSPFLVPTKWYLRYLQEQRMQERLKFLKTLTMLQAKGRIKFDGDIHAQA